MTALLQGWLGRTDVRFDLAIVRGVVIGPLVEELFFRGALTVGARCSHLGTTLPRPSLMLELGAAAAQGRTVLGERPTNRLHVELEPPSQLFLGNTLRADPDQRTVEGKHDPSCPENEVESDERKV